MFLSPHTFLCGKQVHYEEYLPLPSQACFPMGSVYSKVVSRSSLDVMVASTFTAISKFTSKYTNGNKKNQGIKIAHWKEMPSYKKKCLKLRIL